MSSTSLRTGSAQSGRVSSTSWCVYNDRKLLKLTKNLPKLLLIISDPQHGVLTLIDPRGGEFFLETGIETITAHMLLCFWQFSIVFGHSKHHLMGPQIRDHWGCRGHSKHHLMGPQIRDHWGCRAIKRVVCKTLLMPHHCW